MSIRHEVAGGVATITIDRAEKRNALSYAMIAGLGQAFRDAAADDAVRVVVLAGVPGAFCAGMDLGELQATDPDARFTGETPGAADASAEHALELLRCPKP